MTNETTMRPRALITGASAGIGAAFAARLARDGHDLIIVARRRERLDELARELRVSAGVAVEVVAADLSQHADRLALEQRIAADDALALLINNAGFGGYMPFVTLEPDRAEELINVQVLAVTRLTRAALPGMIARGRGAIINVSSRLAFSGAAAAPQLPKRAVYAATKAYINTFTQILRDELQGTGVQVQALCPGVVRTEFHLRMGMDPSRFPAEMVMSPADVVQASLKGLQLGEVICIPALEDPSVLTQIEESQRRAMGQSNSGAIAKRYHE